MDFFEPSGTSESSGKRNTQMPIDSWASYPHRTAEYFPNPWTAGFQTSGPVDSALHRNDLPTHYPGPLTDNLSESLTYPIDVFNPSLDPPSGSGLFEFYPQLLYEPQSHPPSSQMSLTYPPYYQPEPRYPIQDPFPCPQIPVNFPLHTTQSSAAFPTSHLLFRGQNYPPETTHGQYLFGEYSTPISHSTMLQHSVNDPIVHPGPQLLPHETTGTPLTSASQAPAYQPPTQHIRQNSKYRQPRGSFFNGAQNFVINKAVMNDGSNPDNFMSELLKETIPGAAFDSSNRDPPPRCCPGTRLAIIDRIQHFITNCNSSKKMLWIVGPAGVGKSAIMQTVSETTATADIALGASVFFSVNGRTDGNKAITTLAYQFATHYAPYRQFIQDEIAKDPSLPQKSMVAQFKKFIVDPFIYRLHNLRARFLIVIDGLDECNTHDAQCKLLGLISYFCITYPTSPLIWVVASRPEPHITTFLSQPRVTPAYGKEEIMVDSDEGRQDVERFLLYELNKIKMKSPALRDLPRWPTDHDFLKITEAADGLFAYASTVVRFINDPARGNPASQLDEILDIIDSRPKRFVEGKSHPMSHLDALYNRILSRIPTDVMVDAKNILFQLIDFTRRPYAHHPAFHSMVLLSNWLGMTRDVIYGAIYHLHSVLDVPEPDEAISHALKCFHKSFLDYLSNFDRSGFCPDISTAVNQFNALRAHRILEEAPNGTLENGPGTYLNVSLSWPSQSQDSSDSKDDAIMTRNNIMFGMYTWAALVTVQGLATKKAEFQDPFYIHALIAFHDGTIEDHDGTTGGISLYYKMTDGVTYEFSHFLFESQRSELLEHGVLKQIPIGLLDSCNILPVGMDKQVRYRFRCPATIKPKIPDLLDSYSVDSASTSQFHSLVKDGGHRRRGNYQEGQDQDWTTYFYDTEEEKCSYCLECFFHHFKSGKTQSPGDLVTVFIDLHLFGYVEYQYIDPEDGVSEWTYVFPYRFRSLTGM